MNLKISFKNEEGINFLYKLLANSFLVYMNKYESTKYPKMVYAIKNVIKKFENKLKNELNGPFFATSYSLMANRLLKKKHYMYGAYLAAISSFPILSKACKNKYSNILNSIFAKTSAITSIKVLDNINDKLHEKSRAINSLKKYLKAFINKDFQFYEPNDFIEEFENSCFMMARWAYKLVQEGLSADSPTFQMYEEDFKRCIIGQIGSTDQKKDENETTKLSIGEYLKQINEKGVGRIWLDIDFCFFEKSLGFLNDCELEAIQAIRIASDYIFKSSNIYDDVIDLNEDISLGILNSVAFLALDRGYISEKDLSDLNNLVNKLKKNCILEEVIQLGDLILLKGLRYLFKAKQMTKMMDIDALIFSTRVSRAFTIRKWLIREKSIKSTKNVLKSFSDFYTYQIPDYIRVYEKFI
ncbi:MAG: hypothetical protein QW589_08985 [Candidatus Bathyarchaeia archaeon]